MYGRAAAGVEGSEECGRRPSDEEKIKRIRKEIAKGKRMRIVEIELSRPFGERILWLLLGGCNWNAAGRLPASRGGKHRLDAVEMRSARRQVYERSPLAQASGRVAVD